MPGDARRNPTPPLRTQVPWLGTAIAAAALALVTFGVLIRVFLLQHWGVTKAILTAGGVGLLVLGVAACVLGLIVSFVDQSRRGRQCLNCGYPLADIAEGAPCPECGTDRWSEYNVEETPDMNNTQRILAEREQALAEILERLPGRSIRRVGYAEFPECRLSFEESPDLHIADFGVEFVLDDDSIVHATWTAPPSYCLLLDSGPIELTKRDVTSNAAWSPYLGVPIAHVSVQRESMPLNPLSTDGVQAEVPIDVCIRFSNENVLFLAARRYDPEFPDSADTGADSTLVIFGTERATLLGLKPAE